MWLEIYGNKLTNPPKKDLILTLENNIRGDISSLMCDRYVKPDENKKILYLDANIYIVTLCLNHYHMMKLYLIEMLDWKIFQILQMIVI